MKQEKTPADLLIETAESKIGCKYNFGSTGPDEFDCSGFVQWCHKQIGVNNVPRTSGEQYNSGSNSTGKAQCSGVKKVKISNVKPNWGMGENCGYKTFL